LFVSLLCYALRASVVVRRDGAARWQGPWRAGEKHGRQPGLIDVDCCIAICLSSSPCTCLMHCSPSVQICARSKKAPHRLETSTQQWRSSRQPAGSRASTAATRYTAISQQAQHTSTSGSRYSHLALGWIVTCPVSHCSGGPPEHRRGSNAHNVGSTAVARGRRQTAAFWPPPLLCSAARFSPSASSPLLSLP